VTNGSIKVVRRDKTVMLLKDSGVVTYTPRAAWSAKVSDLLCRAILCCIDLCVGINLGSVVLMCGANYS
jgi:hypothetical protein